MKSTEFNISLPHKRAAVLTKIGERYLAHITAAIRARSYEHPESALKAPRDTAYQESIQTLTARFGTVNDLILIGIGGSSLGTEAIYHALSYPTGPRLLVLDTLEGERLDAYERIIHESKTPKSLAVVIISKSGTTTETLANAARALTIGKGKFGAAFLQQVIIIGDEQSPLVEKGNTHSIATLFLPHPIGGRYSAFTAVGMTPLALMGVDTKSLALGAASALTASKMKQALERAVSLTALAEAGMHTVNFFAFNERLSKLGMWYRQLLAESIGKTTTTENAPFSNHLLPIVSTSVDLHSMAQLYLGGLKGQYTHFIYGNTPCDQHTLTEHWLLDTVPHLIGKTPEHIKRAIRDGVLRAYTDQKLPYRYTELSQITAYEIGFLMNTLMLEVMLVCHLLGVNAFNQPDVESYKVYTREELKKR